MLADVPKATVVITNPTHFAVALEYQRERMAAPIVVAKGGDLMAERIKKVAREHGVPIVENVALARALVQANAEVGDSIPGDLFEAVAEVLAHLITHEAAGAVTSPDAGSQAFTSRRVCPALCQIHRRRRARCSRRPRSSPSWC